MSPAEFEKTCCCPVNFKDQGPHMRYCIVKHEHMIRKTVPGFGYITNASHCIVRLSRYCEKSTWITKKHLSLYCVLCLQDIYLLSQKSPGLFVTD